MRELILDDGKYRFWEPDPPEDYELHCDRYGEPWREFVGDNAVKVLFNYVMEVTKDAK